MNDAAPRPLSKLIALTSSLVVAGVAVFALWNYLGGSGGDDPATRNAVIAPVRDAVTAAANHSQDCLRRLPDIAGADLAAHLAATKDCGPTARNLAAAGYSVLDAVTGPDDSPLKAEFLDSAGALLSVYEMQGDDFDQVRELLKNARDSNAPTAALDNDMTYILGNSAADIAAAEAQLDRTQSAYRSGG